MTKVYLEPDTKSRGIQRVKKALVDYAPEGIDIVEHPSDADLTILHVWGRSETTQKKIDWLKKNGKEYAMIQYCLKSTMRPKASDWFAMWRDAKLVWSYYSLNQILLDEVSEGKDKYAMTVSPILENFYYAPLGVDFKVFKEKPKTKEFVIGASAQHALSESVRECAFAAKAVGRKMFHLGHELRRGDDIVCKTDLTDAEVAEYWSQCEFVSGLRRVEGFEFPVIEGLLCGARPIVFDRPEMRHWFGEFAFFIPESTREEVIESLKNVFSEGAEIVTEYEKSEVRARFNWETIISEFWRKLL